MIGISYKNFIDDLSTVLISFVSSMNISFSLYDEEVLLETLFSPQEMFVLFLYDKQSFINYSLRYKYFDGTDTPLFLHLNLQHDNSHKFCSLTTHIKHNIIDKEAYDTLIYSLAENILNDKDFTVNKKIIEVDHKFNDFLNNGENFILEVENKEQKQKNMGDLK